jgi:hypothetical protein
VTGKAEVGETLQAAPGSWDGYPAPDFSYRWQRCAAPDACVDIAGQTGSSYVVVDADSDKTLRAIVTATNVLGSRSANTAATDVVVQPLTGTATVVGSGRPGDVLTATTAWTRGTQAPVTDVTVTYQWQRCDDTGADCLDIAGETASTYTVAAPPQSGRTVRVVATGESPVAGRTTKGTAISAATGVGAASSLSPKVWYTIISKKSGLCIDTTSGRRDDGAAIEQDPCVAGQPSQQWQLIPTSGGWWRMSMRGAPNQVWDVTNASTSDGGKIALLGWHNHVAQEWNPVALGGGYFKVTQRNSGKCLDVDQGLMTAGLQMQQWGCNDSDAQAWTFIEAADADPLIGSASLSGTPLPGKVLTAAAPSWTRGGVDVTEASVTYQWQRCDDIGEACEPIANETASTYAVSAGDSGKTLRVTANASSTFRGRTVIGSATSKATGAGATSPPSTTTWYSVFNVGNTECVDTTSATKTSGTAVDHSPCTAGAASQQWQLIPTDSGYFQVVNRAAPTLNWDVDGGPTATADLVNVKLWTWANGTNQQFKMVPMGGGRFEIVARHSDKCFDTYQTAQVHQYSCNGSDAQLYTFIAQPDGDPLVGTVGVTGTPGVGSVLTASTPSWTRGGLDVSGVTATYRWQRCDAAGKACQDLAGETAATFTTGTADAGNSIRVVVDGSKTINGGAVLGSVTSDAMGIGSVAPLNTTSWYAFYNAGSGKCIDIDGASTISNADIVQSTCAAGRLSQQWHFVPTDSGYYRIESRNAGTRLWDVDNVSAADGARIKTWAWSNVANEQWKPVSQPDGTYQFVVRHSGSCMMLPNGSTAEGAKLQQWFCGAPGSPWFKAIPQP